MEDKITFEEYVPRQSNCYVITDPALREIFNRNIKKWN